MAKTEPPPQKGDDVALDSFQLTSPDDFRAFLEATLTPSQLRRYDENGGILDEDMAKTLFPEDVMAHLLEEDLFETLESYERNFGSPEGVWALARRLVQEARRQQRDPAHPVLSKKLIRALTTVESLIDDLPQTKGRKGGLSKPSSFRSGIFGATIRALQKHGDIRPKELHAKFLSLSDHEVEYCLEDEDLVPGIRADGTADEELYYVWTDDETGRIRQKRDRDGFEPPPTRRDGPPGIKRDTWQRNYLGEARGLAEELSLPKRDENL